MGCLKNTSGFVNFAIFFTQGTAIGKCPKDRLFREYIGLELQVRQVYINVVLKCTEAIGRSRKLTKI